MTAVLERPAPTPSRGGDGGTPARRAVARWSWRLFRREWRQHLLVLILLTVAVAATVAGLAVATNTLAPAATTYTVSGSDAHLAGDLAEFRHAFGDPEVLAHQHVSVAGLSNQVDLRARVPGGSSSSPSPTARVVDGRAPAGADQVVLTRSLAELLGLHVGSSWEVGGHIRQVVGLVENPTDLGDQFALLAPGQIAHPAEITVQVPDTAKAESFRLSSGTPLSISSQSSGARIGAAAAVLVIATLGMLFVGLMAVAGFTVMAHRRLRALGMLSSIGASPRHVRLVMLVDGLAVGATAAVAGTVAGLVVWLVAAPALEAGAGHRIDRFALPWPAIGLAMGLAVVTALAAAWWPARTVSRVPAVAALSGRPPRPRPPRRVALAGVVIGAVGLVLLAAAGGRNPFCILVGIPLTVVGMLLLAPLALAGVARLGGHLPLAPRLAVRDLARNQTRSGAALGALALALGLASVIAVAATDAQASSGSQLGNLAGNQLVVYLNPGGESSLVPYATAGQLASVQRQVAAIAAAVGAHSTLPLEVALSHSAPDAPALGSISPAPDTGPLGSKSVATAVPGSPAAQLPPAALARVSRQGRGIGEEIVAQLYVATPAVLAHYGIDPASVSSSTDVLTSRTGTGGLQLDTGGFERPVDATIAHAALPDYSSAPNSLITESAMDRFGLKARPSAWLIEAPSTLTSKQLVAARRLSAAGQLSVESRDTKASLGRLRTDATLVGVLLALGVLAMTVGLVRSEAANDLRTLVATGASSSTRRSLTAATAGVLGLLGALLGVVVAYAALAAWYHRDLHHLTHVPVLQLVVIVIGLPLAAAAGGWLLAGREPPTMARRPLD